MVKPVLNRKFIVFALLMLLISTVIFAKRKNIKNFIIKKQKNDTLLLSFDYTEIFTKKAIEKLSSGLPTVVLLRVYLKKEGKKKPIRMAIRNCKVVFDIWEENYLVEVKTTGSSKTTSVSAKREAMKMCASVTDFPFLIAGVKEGEYRFAGVCDLNPISKEVLKAMRRWLNRPLGTGGKLSPGDSFFGSFVTIFVNEKIEPSEKTIKFESQKFEIHR